MLKLYISQPMRGKTQEEILRVREKAIAYGIDVIEDYTED